MFLADVFFSGLTSIYDTSIFKLSYFMCLPGALSYSSFPVYLFIVEQFAVLSSMSSLQSFTNNSKNRAFCIK